MLTMPAAPPPAELNARIEEIVLVARREFARRGYRGVTMRGIAAAARISTRTVYNHFADKLALFTACLDAGAAHFPVLDPQAEGTPEDVLTAFAAALLAHLSAAPSYQISQMIFRDGGTLPEIRRVADTNFAAYLTRPVAAYLCGLGAEAARGEELATLFLSMATSEWQTRIMFSDPAPDAAASARHCALVARVFLQGCGLPARA